MNNKILFRGFHPDENGKTMITLNGEKKRGNWVKGDLIHRQIWATALTIIRETDDGFDNYEEYEVIPETIGQFVTTDKKGYDLFDGDIVQGTIVSQWVKQLIQCEIVRNGYEFECREYMRNGYSSHRVKFAKNIELIGNKWECAE